MLSTGVSESVESGKVIENSLFDPRADVASEVLKAGVFDIR